jgi:hypothetical protein
VEEQKENNTDQIYVLSSFVLCDGWIGLSITLLNLHRQDSNYERRPNHFTGFEVLTAVTKNTLFLNVTKFSPVENRRRFGGIYCLHLQCRRVNQASIQQEEGGRNYLLGLFFRPWKWKQCIPSQHQWISAGLHNVVSQKIANFSPLYFRRIYLVARWNRRNECS